MNQEENADELYWAAVSSLKAGHPCVALGYIKSCLEIEINHNLGLIFAGELYLLYCEELGLDCDEACLQAANLFDRLLLLNPEYADAWSGKSLALLYLDCPQEALSCAESGLAVLPLHVGFAMTYDPVYKNVGEALYHHKISALWELKQSHQARSVLSHALSLFPNSRYLTGLIESVMPHLNFSRNADEETSFSDGADDVK